MEHTTSEYHYYDCHKQQNYSDGIIAEQKLCSPISEHISENDLISPLPIKWNADGKSFHFHDQSIQHLFPVNNKSQLKADRLPIW